MKEITEDDRFRDIDFGLNYGGKTKEHPLHKKGKGWNREREMALDLNKQGIDVTFLPEYENEMSADVITFFNNRLVIAAFKYSESVNSNTIAKSLIRGYSQAETVVIKLEKRIMGFCEMLWMSLVGKK